MQTHDPATQTAPPEDQSVKDVPVSTPNIKINLPPDMSYDNLEKVQDELIKKMRAQRQKERALDLNKVRALVLRHGFKWSDIRPAQEPGNIKVPAKYRDPMTGAVWSGRGKEPLWIKGKDRTPYLIG